MELRMRSPVGAGREFDLVYSWPTEDKVEVNYTEEDLAEEIRETFSAVLVDHPHLRLPFRIPPISALCKYETLSELCDKWNDCVEAYTDGRSFQPTKASLPQAQHIISQVYNRTVIYPERLNQYSAFSPNVYGETSPKMVSHMIRQLRITENDTFLDLGSGVGQVVLQMAAAANFKRCVGIETCETPCEYAVGMQNEFQKIMKWYGKTYTEFRLYNGDFLDKKFRDTILKSSIIFANNYAFGPEVDHHLKEIFADLDDGVRIVSSKEFSSVNFRINQRNLSDIGTIMNVSTMTPFEGAVSWTHSKVSFFVHVIDRTKLERYFEEYARSLQNGVPAERPKRRSVKSYDSVDGKENGELEERPKKRNPRPRVRFSQPQKKRPRRSDSSIVKNLWTCTNGDVASDEVIVKTEPEFDDMPDLEVQQTATSSESDISEFERCPPKLSNCVSVEQIKREERRPKKPQLKAEAVLPPGMTEPQTHLSNGHALGNNPKNKVKPPPKKRKTELDKLLDSNWDFSGTSQKQRDAGTSRDMPESSSQSADGPQPRVDDPYANAPWRNVEITNGPARSVDELLARMRVQYFTMIETMKQRAFAERIKEIIRIEQARNQRLQATKTHLEKVVAGCVSDGKKLLIERLAELGYSEDNWQSMFEELQSLGREQVGLSLHIATLKRDIHALEVSIEHTKKQDLMGNIEEEFRRNRVLKETVTELTGLVHQVQGQTPPRTVFPDSPPSEEDMNDDEVMRPPQMYMNGVRSHDRHKAPIVDVAATSLPAVPATASANEPAIPEYRMSPFSILPKKRR